VKSCEDSVRQLPDGTPKGVCAGFPWFGVPPLGGLAHNFKFLPTEYTEKHGKIIIHGSAQLRPPCPILLSKLEGETVASRLYQLSFAWFALFDAKKVTSSFIPGFPGSGLARKVQNID
jgi:hypothetical protein